MGFRQKSRVHDPGNQLVCFVYLPTPLTADKNIIAALILGSKSYDQDPKDEHMH